MINSHGIQFCPFAASFGPATVLLMPKDESVDTVAHMYDHIVFTGDHHHHFHDAEKVRQQLDKIQEALGKEHRDLIREAAGESPIEGVGKAVAQAKTPQA